MVVCESMVSPRPLREAVAHVLFRFLQVSLESASTYRYSAESADMLHILCLRNRIYPRDVKKWLKSK